MATKKLYRVTTQTAKNYFEDDYSIFLVVAQDPSAAYNVVRQFLDDEDLCFRTEPELKCVELLAEDTRFPDCGKRLLIEHEIDD